MLWLAPELALVTFAVMPLMVIAMWIFTEKAKVAYRRTRVTVATLTGEMAESYAGVRVTQAFAREAPSQERFDEVNNDNREANVKANTLSSVLLPVVELCNAAATVAVIAYGGYLIVNGQSTLGVLVAFLAYITRFFQPIRTLTQFYNQLQAATAAAEKVFELMDEPVTIRETATPVHLTRVAGAVEFRTCRSRTAASRCCSDVSFRAEPGEMIAHGRAHRRGQDHRRQPAGALLRPGRGQHPAGRPRPARPVVRVVARAVGLVLQDNFLFSGTIADNIRYARDAATDDEVVDAAKIANAHEFICRMPLGYQTPVLERAANLSLGQRQLIAIARTVLADPQVLILDEATSNIDSQTELLVQQALYQLLAGRTSLVIAHRLSTIRAADQVLVLDAGQIVERGRHDELLSESRRVLRPVHPAVRRSCRRPDALSGGRAGVHRQRDRGARRAVGTIGRTVEVADDPVPRPDRRDARAGARRPPPSAAAAALFSVSTTDQAMLEWRVADSSVQFVGNPPWGVNHHTWVIQQVERARVHAAAPRRARARAVRLRRGALG